MLLAKVERSPFRINDHGVVKPEEANDGADKIPRSEPLPGNFTRDNVKVARAFNVEWLV